jgi:hypothetical protein
MRGGGGGTYVLLYFISREFFQGNGNQGVGGRHVVCIGVVMIKADTLLIAFGAVI